MSIDAPRSANIVRTLTEKARYLAELQKRSTWVSVFGWYRVKCRALEAQKKDAGESFTPQEAAESELSVAYSSLVEYTARRVRDGSGNQSEKMRQIEAILTGAFGHYLDGEQFLAQVYEKMESLGQAVEDSDDRASVYDATGQILEEMHEALGSQSAAVQGEAGVRESGRPPQKSLVREVEASGENGGEGNDAEPFSLRKVVKNDRHGATGGAKQAE